MAENDKPTKKKMSTGVKIALGCGGLIVLVLLCGGIASIAGLFGLGKVANEVSESIEESEIQKENEEKDLWDNPFSIGESVEVEGVEWTIIEAKDMGSTLKATSEYGTDCTANSGKFIYVKMKIKNNTDEMQSTIGTSIYDSEKRKYENSSDVYGCVDDELFILDNINPGIEVTFVQVFEVPTDSSGFKLEVTDLNWLEENHKYVDLGL